jgi:aspartate carbamoyltransferase regulatory subunit
MGENQITGLHFIGTYIAGVVSGNVQSSKKDEKARQQVNKLKLHNKKVERYSGCEPGGGVETMKNVNVGRSIEVHPRV